MAHVLVLTADLLFGSRVHADLGAAGNDVELAADEAEVRERLSGKPPVHALVVDLTDSSLEGPETVARLAHELAGVWTFGYYSHVEPAVRERAEAAGFDLVVPRSRFAREGASLLAGMLASADGVG
jgi:CheY-like chemotaxis protein